MSKRTALLALLVMLTAGAAFAAAPGARFEARMVYDTKIQRIVLYGGISALDGGTKLQYDMDDTWEWNGARWIQRFTPVSPGPRSSHMMVFDSNRQRVLLFGGKNGTAYTNETWIYQNSAWSKLDTPNSPGARAIAGSAFDDLRDRMIIYGGTGLDSAQKAFAYRDTWEFDGTTWNQVGDNGPDVAKPILAYDRQRKQTIMLAVDSTLVSHMYIYDSGTRTWTEKKPTTLPACVNEGMMEYDTTRDLVVYTGGTCTDSSTLEDTYEWNGENWTKVELTSYAGRVFGGAMAYDQARHVMTLYGGFFGSAPRFQTYVYTNPAWLSTGDQQPIPRSLFVFATDPDTGVVWLYGGVASGNSQADMWKYQYGHFELVNGTDAPGTCASPFGAYDTDRKKLVVFCGVQSATFEFDPAETKWVAFTTKHVPVSRSFAAAVYDKHLKKTVLFGGYDGTNFRDDTWVWDGADWTQVKKDPPPSRQLTSMWYDSKLQRTVIFGGVGRLTSEDRVVRYNDMWQFDGVSWAEIKPAALPGMRYGASVAVDPRNGHTLLFGGMQVTGPDTAQVQSYANDTWDWDGTTWKKLDTNGIPAPRDNAGLAFDPLRNEFIMFGGWGGYYFSDIWTFGGTGNNWRPIPDSVLRRRSAGQ
jgi:hypothetical protein